LRTYGLHDIFQRVEANIACRGVDLSVQGHSETLAEGREDERPFTANKWKLDGDQGYHSADDTREVDVDVLSVRV
jgi:hypothetical protein